MKSPTTSISTRDVPVAIRDQFKAYCARRQYTMQGAMIALMRDAIENNPPLKNAGKKPPR
jgi:hypothetical protein